MINVVGEALIDLVDRKGCELEAHVGGSPLNVAIGLARLGTPTTLGTTLGDDDYGQMIKTKLKNDNVLLYEMDETVASSPTNLAEAKVDEQGNATYDFRLVWDPTSMPTVNTETLALHTGSLATSIAPGSDFIIEELKNERALNRLTLTYDPNIRPAVVSDRDDVCARVESIIELVDIVKASEEDVEWLYPQTSFEVTAKKWLQLGPSIVVITRAEKGAFALTNQHQIEIPTPDVDVVDTVGAGDSFTAAFIHTLLSLDLLGGHNREALGDISMEDLELAITRSLNAAAITVSRAGANPPRVEELN